MKSSLVPIWDSDGPSIPVQKESCLFKSKLIRNIFRKMHHRCEIPTIVPYLINSGSHDEIPRPAVIVAPGGGYGGRADHEGEPIALWLNSIGFSAFVLNYRVNPYKHPIPLLDAQRGIRLVRFRSAEWGVDPDRIGMLGFSAGGHLTGCLGTLGNIDLFPKHYMRDEIDGLDAVPNWLVLSYPVISMGSIGHDGCRKNLLGKGPSDNLLRLLSVERNISENTPPTFIWTTEEDKGVLPENSRVFARNLNEAGVEVELQVFPTGGHGLGLAQDEPDARQWTKLCENWMNHLLWRQR